MADETPPDGIRIATLVVLGMLVVAMILQGAYLVTTVRQQRERNECYQAQITQLTDWAATAVDASATSRQAQRELLIARASSPEDRQVAIDRYLAQLDEADRTRQSAPVPEQRCAR